MSVMMDFGKTTFLGEETILVDVLHMVAINSTLSLFEQSRRVVVTLASVYPAQFAFCLTA